MIYSHFDTSESIRKHTAPSIAMLRATNTDLNAHIVDDHTVDEFSVIEPHTILFKKFSEQF